MAVYRQIQTAFWQDDFVLQLTPEEKYFYLYLLTNSKTKQCGIYQLPRPIIIIETGYNQETVEKLLNRFIDYGKIIYSPLTKEIGIVNWLKYNPMESPKIKACVVKELKEVKDKTLIMKIYGNQEIFLIGNSSRYPMEGVSQEEKEEEKEKEEAEEEKESTTGGEELKIKNGENGVMDWWSNGLMEEKNEKLKNEEEEKKEQEKEKLTSSAATAAGELFAEENKEKNNFPPVSGGALTNGRSRSFDNGENNPRASQTPLAKGEFMNKTQDCNNVNNGISKKELDEFRDNVEDYGDYMCKSIQMQGEMLLNRIWNKTHPTPEEVRLTSGYIKAFGFGEVEIAFSESVKYDKKKLAYVETVLKKRRERRDLIDKKERERQKRLEEEKKLEEQKKTGVGLGLIKAVYKEEFVSEPIED